MKKIAILGTIVAVLLAGALFGASALAAGTQGPPDVTVDAGDNGWGCGGGGIGPAGTFISPELQRIAKFLGLTPEDLQTQLKTKSLAQVSQDKGITRQALLDTILAPVKDNLALAVKYGRLTQAQSDTALQQATTNTGAHIDQVSPSGTPGQGCDPGSGRGMMGGSYGGGMMGGAYSGRGMMGGSYGSSMMGGAYGGRGMMGGFGGTW